MADLWAHLPLLAAGLGRSMAMAAAAFLLATGLGLGLGLAMARGARAVALPMELMSACLRPVPELLLVMVAFYATENLLQRLTGQGAEALATGTLVLALLATLQAGEIFRGAVLSLPHAPLEAARALGFSRRVEILHIAIPQMLLLARGGLSNLWLSLLKGTALVSVLGASEFLTAAAQAAGESKAYLTHYLLVQLIFLGLAAITLRWRDAVALAR